MKNDNRFPGLIEVVSNVFVADAFWEPARCAEFLAELSSKEFEPASLDGRRSKMTLRQHRNNDRILWDRPDLADELWGTMVELPLPEFFGSTPIGLNERFRVYRYRPGQRFDWHSDGRVSRPNGEQSLFTFLLYLTDDFEGGDTVFEDASISAQTGSACIFEHKLRHKGAVVTRGEKIVLRTDVMYSPLDFSRFRMKGGGTR